MLRLRSYPIWPGLDDCRQHSLLARLHRLHCATAAGRRPAPAVSFTCSGMPARARRWHRPLADPRSFFVVCDGFKGLPEVVSKVWPEALTRTCIIH